MAEPLMQSIRRHPDRIALVVSGREVTYREFGDRVNAMTASLRDRGVGAGDRVAFLLPNATPAPTRYCENLASRTGAKILYRAIPVVWRNVSCWLVR